MHMHKMPHLLRKRQWAPDSTSTTVWWTPQPGDAAYVSTTSQSTITTSLPSTDDGESSSSSSRRTSRKSSKTRSNTKTRQSSTRLLSTTDTESDDAGLFTETTQENLVIPATSTTQEIETATSTRTTVATSTRLSTQTTVSIQTSVATSISYVTIVHTRSSVTSLPVASSSSSNNPNSSDGVFSDVGVAKIASVSGDLLPSASVSSSALPSSSNAASSSTHSNLLDTLKHSPAYIALACLIGVVVFGLIAAAVAFGTRRWCARRKRDRNFTDADSWIQDSKGAFYAQNPYEKADYTSGRDQASSVGRLSRQSSRHQNLARNRSVEEGHLVPSPAYLGPAPIESSSQQHRWSWIKLGRTHSQESQADKFTTLPRHHRNLSHSQTIARLSQVGQDSSPSSDGIIGNYLEAPAISREVSTEAPTLRPWHNVMMEPSETEAAPGALLPSRFSPFSTPGGTSIQRLSVQSEATIQPLAEVASKRNSQLRQELARKRSSTSSIWSSSTGATEHTYEPYSSAGRSGITPHRRSVSAAAGTSLGRMPSQDSMASFQSDRVSIFRQKLTEGQVPHRNNSRKNSLYDRPRSWEALEANTQAAANRAHVLIKAREARSRSSGSSAASDRTF